MHNDAVATQHHYQLMNEIWSAITHGIGLAAAIVGWSY